jgi:hypothetical protein
MALLAGWERPFRMWHYSVSYRQLLVRSLTEESPTRVDVLFSNVRFMHMPTDWERFEVHEGEGFEPPTLDIPAGTPGKWFVVNDGAGYVYATHCQWHEDEGSALTPSRFGPLKRTD